MQFPVQPNPQPNPLITIGYYNLRGKAQVARLLCQYLQVPYQDKLYSLSEWRRMKTQKFTESWPFNELPYLKQGEFVVTESVPICLYIISRFGRSQLLGKNLIDSSVIDTYLWTIESLSNVISINCQQKSPEMLVAFKKKQWEVNVMPRMAKLQQAAKKDSWFLGYLTVIDFSIYELMRYLTSIFDFNIVSLKKLDSIRQKIIEIPVIRTYEQSNRAITEWCPTKLLKDLQKAE